MNAFATFLALAVLAGAEPGRELDLRVLHSKFPDALKPRAAAVAAVFDASEVTMEGEVARLKLAPSGKHNGLCAGAKFEDEPAGADCTAFLVAPRLVVTAGHCIAKTCSEDRYVFGFTDEAARRGSVPAADVYECEEVVEHVNAGPGEDLALVRLKRDVAGRKPLVMAKERMRRGDLVFALGHPFGISVTHSGTAEVRSGGHDKFFANLAVFPGNSGGPVFVLGEGRVAGVLTHADELETGPADCKRAVTRKEDSLEGAFVGRLGALSAAIERASAKK